MTLFSLFAYRATSPQLGDRLVVNCSVECLTISAPIYPPPDSRLARYELEWTNIDLFVVEEPRPSSDGIAPFRMYKIGFKDHLQLPDLLQIALSQAPEGVLRLDVFDVSLSPRLVTNERFHEDSVFSEMSLVQDGIHCGAIWKIGKTGFHWRLYPSIPGELLPTQPYLCEEGQVIPCQHPADFELDKQELLSTIERYSNIATTLEIFSSDRKQSPLLLQQQPTSLHSQVVPGIVTFEKEQLCSTYERISQQLSPSSVATLRDCSGDHQVMSSRSKPVARSSSRTSSKSDEFFEDWDDEDEDWEFFSDDDDDEDFDWSEWNKDWQDFFC